MECKDARELLSPYLDRELAAADAEQVRVHLKACDSCRRVLAEMRKSWDILGLFAAPAVSGNFNARFWKKIGAMKTAESAAGEPQPIPLLIRIRRIAGYAAAAAIIVGLCIYLVFGGPSGAPAKQLSSEDAQVVENLEVLESLEVVKDLDVVENLDILTQLDEMDLEQM
jgi:anti-sigma factor RsiW